MNTQAHYRLLDFAPFTNSVSVYCNDVRCAHALCVCNPIDNAEKQPGGALCSSRGLREKLKFECLCGVGPGLNIFGSVKKPTILAKMCVFCRVWEGIKKQKQKITTQLPFVNLVYHSGLLILLHAFLCEAGLEHMSQ